VAVSRALAYAVSDRAVSVLYLANRLVELPLGLFVTAVSTVIFPRLSQLEAKREKASLREEFQRGMFWIWVIIFPAALGILSLDRPLLNLLFLWGNFTERDLEFVLPVLRIFLIALPFYALSTHFLRGYYCKKNTAWPMAIAAIHFAVNTSLTLCFMFGLETVGIALAHLLSIAIQTILLYLGLRRLYGEFCIDIGDRRFGNVVWAGIFMAAVVKLSDYVLGLYLSGKVHGAVSVGLNIPLGALLYFGLLYALKGRKPLGDWGVVWRRIIKKIKKSKAGER
jgi:putative peptidoglycan lipid II flippase